MRDNAGASAPKGAERDHEETSAHGLPGLPKDAKRVYEGIVRTGATSPTSGRDAKWLAKELHMGRKDMEHQLHLLEGKGVVGHQTSGHDTNWYVKRT